MAALRTRASHRHETGAGQACRAPQPPAPASSIDIFWVRPTCTSARQDTLPFSHADFLKCFKSCLLLGVQMTRSSKGAEASFRCSLLIAQALQLLEVVQHQASVFRCALTRMKMGHAQACSSCRQFLFKRNRFGRRGY